MSIQEGSTREELAIEFYNKARGYEKNKNNDKMVEYYKQAVELQHIDSMLALGCHYRIKKDNAMMFKYYTMAYEIDKTNNYAIAGIGDYYGNIGDYDEMMKYYNIVIDRDTDPAYTGIIYWYIGCHHDEHQNYDQMIKYYNLAITRGDYDACDELMTYYLGENDINNVIATAHIFLDAAKDNDDCKKCSIIGRLVQYYIDHKNMTEYIKYKELLIDITTGQNCIHRMFTLNDMIRHYKKCNDGENVQKYYKLEIKDGDTDAISLLGEYYEKTGAIDDMKAHYLQAIGDGYDGAAIDLGTYYHSNKLYTEGFDVFMKLKYQNIKFRHICDKKCDSPCDYSGHAYIRKYICKFLRNETVFDNFFDEHMTMKNDIATKDTYIEELEIMPEGPKYAQAKDRFNKAVQVMNVKNANNDKADKSDALGDLDDLDTL
ncbi:MAG: hypothetical protein Faunusvirus11_12 [Faunusvirus sp.]|jgi:tetratricopeptide (TPR) repeat protein|uniref:Sel1 repeat family protein n=1 Tax=Faunusvirus sp. TaxID=2487766 RepID=A0A3G5A0K8_9VIRU|nr:MAG: hypothetical protein Faunusvirus11_12 [Faunusvirus sp.]